ncbi:MULTISPECIES: hypothetical protein [Salinibaculum]|uniref:hypothetical protein n=1 Tax=Salinibaculum TaxID=2732368 RepID=UPI0030D15CE3
MRYKIVPEPRSREALLAARDALPLVPGSVEDCCTRIRDRTDVPSRDRARELLTFLQALGLAKEASHGFHRVRGDVTDEQLREAFLANVYGAREIVDALADSDGPLDAADALAAIRDGVPRWERSQYADWEAEWRERAANLLAWAETFGLAASVDGGYVATDP